MRYDINLSDIEKESLVILYAYTKIHIIYNTSLLYTVDLSAHCRATTNYGTCKTKL